MLRAMIDPMDPATPGPAAGTAAARAAADYRALREDAAAIDLSGWTLLRLRGADVRPFLQGLASQDLSRLRPGEAASTLFLTEKGRPVALAWVAVSPDRADPDAAASAGAAPGGHPSEVVHVIADEGARESLRAHFERFRVMEDVEIEGPGRMPRLVGIAGPNRNRIVAEAGSVIHGATGIAAEPLSFLLLPPDVPPISLPALVHPAATEAWRLAVGLPRTGIDFDAERIATELSLPGVLSHTKGCYVGQEVVARTSTRGHVRRQRVGFRFRWEGEPLQPGTELRANGATAGFVTSTAPEPGSADGLGMGYLSAGVLEAPVEVVAVQGPKTTHLRVTAWPL
jgi:folate-binding protein YgfZ